MLKQPIIELCTSGIIVDVSMIKSSNTLIHPNEPRLDRNTYWHYMNQKFNQFSDKVNSVLDRVAPIKKVKFQPKKIH